MIRTIRRNEAAAVKRRLYFIPRDVTDGVTAELGEAGGQPEVSVDGGAFAGNGSIGTLQHISDGHYYAEVAQAVVDVNAGLVRGRFKSANTTETAAENALDVGGDLMELIARFTNTTELDLATSDLSVKHADGTTEMFPLTDEGVTAGVHKMQR